MKQSGELEFDFVMPNNEVIRNDLRWWRDNIMISKRDIIVPPVDVTMYSDASMKGWGGHTADNDSTGGDWSMAEQNMHINELELRAAFLTLQAFCNHLSNVHIRLMMDNTSAIACVNNYGSMTEHLMDVTDKLRTRGKYCVQRWSYSRCGEYFG